MTHLNKSDQIRVRRSFVILAITMGGWVIAVASHPEVIAAALRML
jgi:hypothetical protein